MAFTTEFVMGAGGSVEEIPVPAKTSGGQAPLVTTTVSAGTWIVTYAAPGNPAGNFGATITPGPWRTGQTIVYSADYTAVTQIVVGPATVTVTPNTSHRAGEGTLYVARLN